MDKMNYEVEEVHISTIQAGDTILHTDGLIRTVDNVNIRHSSFMGITLFGDSYHLGNALVKRLRIITVK
ncbi:hypothetical protein NXX39_20730 [Bacteroides ovatus]|jgi:hypothetical protein|uniref:hypothetical protein n=1 Tax=Bacteroides ovatus TaxID=28116 RepID=UPI001CC96A84|nr:hypothetical protein [Bacteroides ovatus]MCS2475505.1 hypothetical protein [Bacteroides ovatus]MCS3099750.1 hypothetical protein [Bacteroides ovatus]UBF06673.1 hypothetical protein K6V23_19830 [Bacteroides ovatus]DAU74132.1 MAG TPA: hypothetical protein [Crassvirales sp.]